MKPGVWPEILTNLESKVSRPNFVTWLKLTEIIEDRGGEVTISVPNLYAKSWIEKNLLTDIKKLLNKHYQPLGEIRLVVKTKPKSDLEDLPLLQFSETEEPEATKRPS